MPHGSKQAKAKAPKKMKQINTDLKPIVELQFNVVNDKRVKPAEVFEGFKDNKSKSKSKSKSNKSKSNK